MAVPVNEEPQIKSKKPSNSAFKQQKLPAWQPILTAGTVLPTFFIIGLAFIPIGIGLLVSSNNVQEYQIEYTHCNSSTGEMTCAEAIQDGRISPPCQCHLFFNLTTTFRKDVFVYYGLTNYYQNHRRYVKSRDDAQLLGDVKRKLSSDCEPFAYENGTYPIAPCGAIANSLFNDVIKLYHIAPSGGNGDDKDVPLLSTDIAWPTDKNVKFRNPEPTDNLKKAFEGTAKPPAWDKKVYELDKNPNNNGFQNEDLIVWMRTAALPTFRKLYRRVNHEQEYFKLGLPVGQYKLVIDYNYAVTSFKGTKRIILSNTSWLGGKNPFLGIAYIVVGSICLVLAIVFLIIHFKFGKSTHELINISQRTPY